MGVLYFFTGPTWAGPIQRPGRLILELIWGSHLGGHSGRPFGRSFWEALGVTQNSAPNSGVWPRPGQTLEKTQHSHAIWPSEPAGAGLGPGPLILGLYFGTPI